MYMRLIQATYKLESLSKIRGIFDESIIPRLQGMEGCLCVCLMKSELHPNEAISISLWDSQAHAEAYEGSGMYREFLEELKPYLADSSEWKIQLSKELTLEYQPVPKEPLVKAGASVAQMNTEIPVHDESSLMYLRILSLKIQPGKMEEFRRIYTQEIIPALRAVKGCRYAYLTENIEDQDEALSITVWDSKQAAGDYERSGLFDQLKEKVKHTFAELYQWKMALEKQQSGQVVTSEDLRVKTYSIVTGKSFQ